MTDQDTENRRIALKAPAAKALQRRDFILEWADSIDQWVWTWETKGFSLSVYSRRANQEPPKELSDPVDVEIWGKPDSAQIFFKYKSLGDFLKSIQ